MIISPVHHRATQRQTFTYKGDLESSVNLHVFVKWEEIGVTWGKPTQSQGEHATQNTPRAQPVRQSATQDLLGVR